METVAVVGVGLIGGSFALAIRQSGFKGKILGVSSSSTVIEALRLGVIDEGASLLDAAAAADLIYLAQPINQILQTIQQLSGKIRNDALVTDAGSTKGVIAEQALRYLPAGQFLGGHPMAGKEVRGVAAAEPGLFTGRNYFFCAASEQVLDHPIAEEMVDLVVKFGARPVLLSPAEHDTVVSLTSHLPQVASTALASCLSKALDSQLALNGAGPGLLDMSRLALSSFDLWSDILFTNENSIDRALGLYIEELEQLRAALRVHQAGPTFERSATFSRMIRNRPS